MTTNDPEKPKDESMEDTVEMPVYSDGTSEVSGKDIDAIFASGQLNELLGSPDLDIFQPFPAKQGTETKLIGYQPVPDEEWPGTIRPSYERDIGTVEEVKAREKARLDQQKPPEQKV